jgi:hypothetical protein
MSEKTIPVGGLLSREELNNFEYIRAEFTTPIFKPKITLDYDNFTLNAACVRLFPESEYVQMLADQHKRRLLIWPCGQFDKDSIKWSNIKNGKPQSRSIRAKMLCAKIFRMMKWVTDYRYKVMAVFQEFDELRFVVFNLIECEMYVPGEVTSPDGTVKKKRRKVFPDDWERSFGTPYAEHQETYQTNISTMYLLSNSEEDDTTARPAIIPRIPTASEIITRNYYVPDELVKGEDKK